METKKGVEIKTIKEFGCEQCGYMLNAAPPDDFHIVFSIKKIRNDCIESIYKCDDCGIDITRYWCKQGTRVVSSTKYNTRSIL